ncbi:MAG: 23S rRNA (guanosine(2251)-2'-O)-methyltransferase RlmB [Melioribacteraceae bacterium]|nr:23S rRNA (guanosine(2251)-2'-O)-methyltransferase RlmB [Melioribacteraceae bacterium]
MNRLYGRKPVFEAIKAGDEIEQVFIAYGQHGGFIEKIKLAAKKNNIKVSEVSLAKFKEMAEDKNTQGVIATLSELNYSSLGELITYSTSQDEPFLLLLDSIQDPQNLGAILRTAECTGVDGVIITTHNSAPITDTAIKTSAGAVSHLKICKVNNLANAMSILKEKGFWITGTALGGDKSYSDVDYKGPAAIVMGNEENGIRNLTAKNCDFLVEIPMKGKIQSLNVSVATGVILFEVLRQRGK